MKNNFELPAHILAIQGKTANDVFQGSVANCFWATSYFYAPQLFPPKKLTGNEILKFLAEEFIQVEQPKKYDIFVIWSRSDPFISPDKVNVHFLSTYPQGFPFGLVVEHSGVLLDDDNVFQKASPKADDPFEVIGKDSAFSTYLKMPWVCFTYHRRKI